MGFSPEDRPQNWLRETCGKEGKAGLMDTNGTPTPSPKLSPTSTACTASSHIALIECRDSICMICRVGTTYHISIPIEGLATYLLYICYILYYLVCLQGRRSRHAYLKGGAFRS